MIGMHAPGMRSELLLTSDCKNSPDQVDRVVSPSILLMRWYDNELLRSVTAIPKRSHIFVKKTSQLPRHHKA